MSDMRLIKRQGSKLSVSDSAYVIFNSYEGGFVMGVGYMPKCEKCGGRFTLNNVSVYRWEMFFGPVLYGSPSCCEGGWIKLCSDCVDLMESEGYVMTFEEKVASRKDFFIR